MKLSVKTKKQLEQYVEAGAAYLTVIHPKWWKHIDPLSLDLSDDDTCIIGQLYGSFDDAREKIGIRVGYDNVAAKVEGNGVVDVVELLGLFVPIDREQYRERYEHLDILWKKKIAQMKRKKA